MSIRDGKEVDEGFSSIDPAQYVHVYASEVQWEVGRFDEIFRAIADEVLSNVFVFGGEGDASWLYHPYDGGADIILATSAKRDQLSKQHSSWLSSHPEGL